VRPGSVRRTGLVNRLRAERSLRLATVVATSGYGKTTLLAQWAARDERPFAWLSLDEHDNDPLILLRHLAAAFERVEPLAPSVVGALAASDASVWPEAAPKLAAAIAGLRIPFVLVLDDAHLLRPGDSADVVLALAGQVPEGSMLVLAGREPPPLPIPRLRAAGRVLELGDSQLALSRRESLLLVRNAGLEVEDEVVAELVDRSEGWAAGLYLALRAPETIEPDRYVAEYIWSEHLAQLKPELLEFLRRTAVLERLSGPLCDAVLARADSAHELEELGRSHVFLVPLDSPGWCRYHRLFREVLLAQLEQHEPQLVATLHERAADWFEAHGEPEPAFAHAQASNDAERAARILMTIAFAACSAGRFDEVERWLDGFAAFASLDEHPDVAVLEGWVHALRGRAADAEARLELARRRARTTRFAAVRPSLALLRAALCADGAERMSKDADAALATLPPESPWWPAALAVQGAGHALRGRLEAAEASFAAAAGAAERLGTTDMQVLALGELSLLAAARGDHAAAERHALEARALLASGDPGERATDAVAHAAAARALLRHGRWDEARTELAAAERLARLLTHALPWLAAQTRLELASAFLTLRDRDRAHVQLEELAHVLAVRPQLGALAEHAGDLRRRLDELPDPRAGHNSRLTGAELRLLPFLATHLSFREIGDRLYVSRNTVKTQAISVYRKLGVSSRSAAIDRASELGLLDETAALSADLIRAG
jgi:LuxR family maltose regulon positive regulatory protein